MLNVRTNYSDQFLEEYRDIRKAGFLGTIKDYIDYKTNYGKDRPTKNEDHFTDDEVPF